MNTLIIILIVALVALQIAQLRNIAKLTREVKALRSERNTKAEVKPVAENKSVAMETTEPAPAAEEIATPIVEAVAEPEPEPEPEQAEPVVEAKESRAEKPKKERKEISSEDILFWTILGVIAVLGIFFAIAL